jgi:hypothetical protein
MNKQEPIARKYQLGTCYLCQLCLTCNKTLAFDTCECNIIKKPKNQTKKREFYGRIYNSKDKEKLVQSQINELKKCDKYFGYSSDFNGHFQFSLCSKCHNKFARLKRNTTKKSLSKSLESDLDLYDSSSNTTTPVPASSSPTPASSTPASPMEPFLIEDSSNDEYDITEFNFKFIIRPCNEKARPAKWESFKALTLVEFEDEVLDLVQNQFDPFIRKKDYIIIYKSSMHGMGIQLTDEKCWKKFLPEYQKILSNEKELFIIIEIKEKRNKRKKR